MAVLTVNQIIDNIDSFIANIKKLSKSYYLFVGKPTPWTDDANPPAANASVERRTQLTRTFAQDWEAGLTLLRASAAALDAFEATRR